MLKKAKSEEHTTNCRLFLGNILVIAFDNNKYAAGRDINKYRYLKTVNDILPNKQIPKNGNINHMNKITSESIKFDDCFLQPLILK